MAKLKTGTRVYGSATIDSTLTLNGISISKGAVSGAIETSYTAGGSGLILSPFWVRQDTLRSKATNNTTLEAIFNTPHDTINLIANTLYYFRGVYIMSSSATGTAQGLQTGFIFSNAQQDIQYTTKSYTQASSTTITARHTTVATATTVTATATASTNYIIEIEGYFKSNATTGGTLIPAFAQSAAGTTVAPTVSAYTWFTLQPISVGNTSPNAISGAWA